MSLRTSAKQSRKPTADRQPEIVEAAMRILAAGGPRKLTAQLLAAEIGITAGALFRHFKSMEEIVDAVVDRLESILFADFPPAAADPLERLHLFFGRRISAIVENPHVSHILFSSQLAQAGGSRQAARIDEFKRRSGDFVFDCLDEAVKGGALRGGSGTEEGAILVLGSIMALAHADMRRGSRKRIRELSERVWTLIEGALRGRN